MAKELLPDKREDSGWYRVSPPIARMYFAMGYDQAEKDLALIPEDMSVIFNLVRDLQGKYSDTRGCYEEALDLFNKARNAK